MEGILVMWGGIILVVGIVTLLDWIARRRDRQSGNRAA